MILQPTFLWKKAPFLRLVIPFIIGILSWYFHQDIISGWIIFCSGICSLLLLKLTNSFFQFRYGWIKGLFFNVLLFSLGNLIVSYHDSSNDKHSLECIYKKGDIIIATIEEQPAERTKTFKATASVETVISKNNCLGTNGNILLYFQKDNTSSTGNYGTTIIFSKPLLPIQSSGNPGSFDYQRYCHFQNIDYQVYLQKKDYRILKSRKINFLKNCLVNIRTQIIHVLQTFLTGEKETGLAEALLIGYKDDLDKNLIQSYSHTGVVHIIAISGLHLALIYELLQFFLKKFRNTRAGKWLQPIIVIASLWLFSFLSGASPSVLRSAVMFTFVVIGNSLSKSGSIYNSLSASAFFLLCYNPFWLWDVGFQLSYAAVLSIVIFFKPVYHWFFIQNKILDLIWKTASVTISAQVLTTPISIYQFHQFPNYFLFTNLLAVPLSSLVLLGELFVCSAAFIPLVARIAGTGVSWMIFLLNSFIEHMESLPFSVWGNLYINSFQLFLFYIIIVGMSGWLLKKNKSFLLISLPALLCFSLIRTLSFIRASRQAMLIVYNVPRYQAVDFIEGRKFFCQCDNTLSNDQLTQNFFMQPARTMYRVSSGHSSIIDLNDNNVVRLASEKIMVIDRNLSFKKTLSRISMDVIVVSKNPSVNIHNLSSVLDCRLWIFDSSNSYWKISRWKRECDELGLFYYSIPDKGALVMKMN
jgi:competence protein ComEC